MKEAMNKFDNAVSELMDICKGELGRIMFDAGVDERAIDLVRRSFSLVNAAMELTREQTKTMIDMNEKLNKLIDYTKE